MNTFPLFTLIPERSLEVSHYKELQDSTFPFTEPHTQSNLKSIYLLTNTTYMYLNIDLILTY